MNRLFILFATLLVFLSCGENKISTSGFPKTYAPYDDNYFERLIWRLQGIDTISYAGTILLKQNNYTYKGCYCIVNGNWEQRNDSLLLHHTSVSHDTTKPFEPEINCFTVDSIYQIFDGGNKLKVLDGRENFIRIYELKE